MYATVTMEKFIRWSIISLFLLIAVLVGVGIDSRLPAPIARISDLHASIPVNTDGQASSENFNFSPGNAYKAEPVSYDAEEKTNISVYDNTNRAVVNISTEVIAYDWFFDAVPRQKGSGSGSIIDEKGYILTNYHVIRDANRVIVRLYNDKEYEGKVVGIDAENDLALVYFDPQGEKLPTISLGDSSSLKVGQKVLAIGNPFAFERTLTTGTISGLGRPIRNENGLIMQNMIQTDAAINPGNSGGPLLNTKGQMIGVNTMIYSPSGGSVGIGFAVPIDTAKRVLPDLKKYGYVRRGEIDADLVSLFPALVRYANLPIRSGLLVSSVKRGGEADKAGLCGGTRDNALRISNHIIYLGGDIIIEINKHPIANAGDYYAAMEHSRPGENVELTIIRGMQKLTLTTKLIQRQRPAR